MAAFLIACTANGDDVQRVAIVAVVVAILGAADLPAVDARRGRLLDISMPDVQIEQPISALLNLFVQRRHLCGLAQVIAQALNIRRARVFDFPLHDVLDRLVVHAAFVGYAAPLSAKALKPNFDEIKRSGFHDVQYRP